jgi:hypothetical protein
MQNIWNGWPGVYSSKQGYAALHLRADELESILQPEWRARLICKWTVDLSRFGAAPLIT